MGDFGLAKDLEPGLKKVQSNLHLSQHFGFGTRGSIGNILQPNAKSKLSDRALGGTLIYLSPEQRKLNAEH